MKQSTHTHPSLNALWGHLKVLWTADIPHWGPGPRNAPLPYFCDPATAGPATPSSWAYFLRGMAWDTWAVSRTPAWQCLPLWPGGWRWERPIVPVWGPLSWSHNRSQGWSLFSCQESESAALRPVFSLILTLTLGGRHQRQKGDEETGLESLGVTAFLRERWVRGECTWALPCLALAACLPWRRLWGSGICPWSPERLGMPGVIRPSPGPRDLLWGPAWTLLSRVDCLRFSL